MAHGAGFHTHQAFRALQADRRRDAAILAGQAMQSPAAKFKLSRGLTRPDERFDTLAELAKRLHGLRRGRSITCSTAFNARACKPNGHCVSVRAGDDGELIGHAFLADPGPADRQRLEAAIRATEPRPDFRAQLGEDAEIAA